MKVAFLLPNFFFIGAQRAAASALREIDRSKISPFVFVIDPVGSMRDELPPDIEVCKLPKGGVFSMIPFFRIFTWPFRLRNLVDQHSIDCVVSICPQTNFTLVLYKIFFNSAPKMIGEEHQHLSNALKNDPNDFKFPWKFLYYFSLKKYYLLDKLRCVSHSAALDFERVWSVPKSTIATVYPAFDLERIKKRSHGVVANNAIPVICSVGRLTSQKDFSLLIRAFSIVRKVMPARLRIAGTGPEQEMLIRLIHQLKLQRDVELLGFIEYAEELIAESDLFVMTSIWEGFPATLVEAMVLETPVVSVNCESGPAELIQDGINGALVEVRSPGMIAERIIFLLQNPEIRAAYSSAAKKTVQQYSLKASVSALEQLILGV